MSHFEGGELPERSSNPEGTVRSAEELVQSLQTLHDLIIPDRETWGTVSKGREGLYTPFLRHLGDRVVDNLSLRIRDFMYILRIYGVDHLLPSNEEQEVRYLLCTQLMCQL